MRAQIFTLLIVAIAWSAGVSASVSEGKVLILYASTGGGKSAANAIANQIEELKTGLIPVPIDTREFENPEDVRRATAIYDFMTQKTPLLYDWMYRVNLHLGGREDVLGNLYRRNLYKANDKLLNFILEQKPAAIVSTFDHVTGGILAARAAALLPSDLPILQVLTDNVDSKFYLGLIQNAEITFVPNAQIRDSYVDMGAPNEKVFASGIPTNPSVTTALTAEARTQLFRKLGFDETRPLVLMVSGSAGVGNFAKMLLSIQREADPQNLPQVAVVTARNTEQFAKVNELLAGGGIDLPTRLFGTLPQPELLDLMKAADLIVTKAGGLSTSEIAKIGKPLVLLDINGGQEGYNVRLFISRGMAVSTHRFNEVGSLVRQLVDHPEERVHMALAQAELVATQDPHGIGNWLVNHIVNPLATARDCESRLSSADSSPSPQKDGQ